MLSIVEEHARSITVLKISACGNYLATASKDGAVKIFLSAKYY
jgi:WD40 repeat protein